MSWPVWKVIQEQSTLLAGTLLITKCLFLHQMTTLYVCGVRQLPRTADQLAPWQVQKHPVLRDCLQLLPAHRLWLGARLVFAFALKSAVL